MEIFTQIFKSMDTSISKLFSVIFYCGLFKNYFPIIPVSVLNFNAISSHQSCTYVYTNILTACMFLSMFLLWNMKCINYGM